MLPSRSVTVFEASPWGSISIESRQSLIQCVNSDVRFEYSMDCEPLCVGCTGMTYALRMYLMGCEDKCGNGEKNGVGITSGKAAKCAGRTLGA